ncbi:MAG: DivIVA domain-containing protein [Geodermatophilaceae bacterium]|nr:DivIVA domain-containing protein [Geodermatophilaceae bacterium]
MPLTPADVHNVAFKKPPIGKRGYDEDEVDAFLDLVEAEFARLIEENNDLRSRISDGAASSGASSATTSQTAPTLQKDAAPAAPAPAPAPSAAAPAPPTPSDTAPVPVVSGGDEMSQATRMLALATETADRHMAEAKAAADKLRADAKAETDKLLGDSKGKSESQLSDARTRSEAMLADAKTKAQQLTQDAERKHVETMGTLEQRKGGLEKQIESLRVFEREYRTRLQSYLESQLRDLGARNSAEPAAAGNQNGAGSAPS